MSESSNYYFYGAQCDRLIPTNLPIQDRLNHTGANTGNLFIYSAVERQLGVPKQISTIGQSLDASVINSEFNKIIIPASNFLNAHSDFSYIVKLLEKIKIPIIVIGLGAQARNFHEKINLPPATIRFMHILADRCVSMGVRGFFTAEQLFSIGIKNVDVIGCPTIYFSKKKNFRISKPTFSASSKIAINYFRKFEIFDLILMLEKYSSTIIFQDELFEVGIKSGETSQQEINDYWLFKKLGKQQLNRVLSFIKDRQKMFFQIDDWMTFLSTQDFSLGPRLHGNMIALQSGVPSLWFTHDTRTKEICEFARFPNIKITDLKKCKNIEELYELADFSKFNAIYPELYQNYVNFLNKNGVEHKLEQASEDVCPNFQLGEYYLFKENNPKIISNINGFDPNLGNLNELNSIKASRVYRTALKLEQMFPPSSLSRRIAKKLFEIFSCIVGIFRKK